MVNGQFEISILLLNILLKFEWWNDVSGYLLSHLWNIVFVCVGGLWCIVEKPISHTHN